MMTILIILFYFRSIKNLDMYVLCFDDFGKNFPKSLKLSPDGFIQAAIQLTYYKLVQYTVLTHFVQLYILLCSLCVCLSLCPSSSLPPLPPSLLLSLSQIVWYNYCSV